MNPSAPRNVGLVLIAAGVISLVMFTHQYRATVRAISTGPYAPLAHADTRLHTQPYLVAWAVILIGVLAFGSVFVHF